MTKYQTELENLIRACEIAIQTYSNFWPKHLKKSDLDWTILCENERKNRLINRKTPFNTLVSLKDVYEEIFTYFQEGSGQMVDEFWKLIKESGLPYKRENKLAKILKRGKVKNHIEYDFIKDVIGPYLQDNMITTIEAELLDSYLMAFEVKSNK
jgi:hypothetical protein